MTLSDLIHRPDWMSQAACDGAPPEWFYPPKSERPTKARAVCATCPVAEPCLDYALTRFTNKDDHGVWAGTTVKERRALRAQRQRRAG